MDFATIQSRGSCLLWHSLPAGLTCDLQLPGVQKLLDMVDLEICQDEV